MLLAAGLGTRMLPLTSDLAKPALPVLDEPLILRLARTLAAQGIDEIIVNTHSNADSLHAALAESPLPVLFSHEPRLQGSGGGVREARDALIGPEPFLVVNADMVVDIDVDALLGAHQSRGALVTLLLRDDPRKERFGTLGFDSQGRVTRIVDLVRTGPERGSGLFTGVHVMEPALLDRMPAAESFDSMRDLYVPLLEEGETIGTILQPDEARWWPVGTPEELLRANMDALSEISTDRKGPRLHVAADARVEGKLTPPVWIGGGARVERGAHVGADAVVGQGAVIGRGARVEGALVLPGAEVPAKNFVRGGIMGREGIWQGG
jgi:NDP-sugar pyrophosphorylase family protein